MPNGDGPGWGSRGDVGIEHIHFDPVKTTWQQTVRLALGLTIAYLCLFLIVTLVILFGWGWSWWWWLFRYLIEVLLIPVPVFWGVAFVRAVHLYYAVVQKSPNWPPPQSQVNPLETGIVSAYDFPVHEPEHEDRVVVSFEGTITDDGNGGKTSRHWRLNTEYPEEWQRFAKALSGPLPFLRCRFSVREARSFGVPDEEFSALRDGWLRTKVHPMAYRTSTKRNAHTRLTRWGLAYMRELARTPLP